MGNVRNYLLTGDPKYLEGYEEDLNRFLEERCFFSYIACLSKLGKSISIKKESGLTYAYILEGSYFSPETTKEVKSIKDINKFISEFLSSEGR